MGLAVGPGESWSALDLRVCTCAQKPAIATGVGLWSWGSLCPDGSNWRDWDPGAVTGQTESLNLAARGIYLVCM